MFRTRSLSLMYCVNLAELTHISLQLMRVLKIKLYEIGVSICIIYDFFSIINEIIFFLWQHLADCYYAYDHRLTFRYLTNCIILT